MTTSQKFIPVICLLVGLVLGFTGGKILGDRAVAGLKARVIGTTGMSIASQIMEVKQLSGTIKSINGNTLAVTLSYPRDPFGDPALDERTVTVGDSTKISVSVQKDQVAFEKELAAFQKKMSALSTAKPGAALEPSGVPIPPQMFEKKDGEISVLKVGQTVNITTAENVKDAKHFTAATIEVAPTSVAGAIPPPPATSVPVAGATSIPPPPPPTSASTGGTTSIPPPPPPAH